MFNRLAKQINIDVNELKTGYKATKPPARATRDGDAKKKILYSTVTVALRLLLTKPSLASQTLASDKIRELQKPGAELLADVIDRIKHKRLSNAASIVESFRESPHQESLTRLLATFATPEADTEIEFKDAMRQLEIEITEQKIEQLQKELSTDESGQTKIHDLLKHLHKLKSQPIS